MRFTFHAEFVPPTWRRNEVNMLYGYMGKVLWVDLGTGEITEETLNETDCRRYLGGYGIGAKILFDNMKANEDPLGPGNILGFVAGLFTGTSALGGTRFSVVGKSPLTGTWGDSSAGGKFGPYLRFSGYDGVFFKGLSEKPIYLLIDNGKAEIRDAAHLWGKGIKETEDILKEEWGKDAQIASIAPFGEKLSLVAGIMTDKGRAAARSGLGAVMGSKKLKAVVVKGDMEIPYFNPELEKDLRKEYISKLTGVSLHHKKYGTPGMVEVFAQTGDMPVRNWTQACDPEFPHAERIGGEAVDNEREKKYACYKCPLACGGHMKDQDGRHKYKDAHMPEYEVLGLFGANCQNDNLISIIKANDLCNENGMDAISAGNIISFAIECYENGIITKEDTGGIELAWGDDLSIIQTLEKVIKREGIGDVLADGVMRASERLGQGTEKFAMHIGGQELPSHDPKAEYGFASCYITDATPGRHMRWHGAFIPPGVDVPAHDPHGFSGRGPAQKVAVTLCHTMEGLGCCGFLLGSYPHIDPILDFIYAQTGWKLDVAEFLQIGERLANIRQAFNIREGINMLEYKIPDRFVGNPPIDHGPNEGVTLDPDVLRREFLEVMDWGFELPIPSREKLLELDLDNVETVLYPAN